MESWLPYVHPERGRCCPTYSPPAAQVVLVEPRRIRDRAVQLLDEEAALADALAVTWGADGRDRGRDSPRLHLPFERLLRERRPACSPCPSVPEGPSTPGMTVRGFNPVAGDRPDWPPR